MMEIRPCDVRLCDLRFLLQTRRRQKEMSRKAIGAGHSFISGIAKIFGPRNRNRTLTYTRAQRSKSHSVFTTNIQMVHS